MQILARSPSVIADSHIDTLNPEQLRQALRTRQAEFEHKDELVAQRDSQAAFKHAVIDKLAHGCVPKPVEGRCRERGLRRRAE